MAEKIFVDGMWCKRQEFSNGGNIVKVSMHVDRVIAWLQAQERSEKGYVNISLQSSREQRLDENGNVILNASLDDWKPTTQGQQSKNKKGKSIGCQAKQVNGDRYDPDENNSSNPFDGELNIFDDDSIPF